MQRLLEVMRQLRALNGCPWDREQTHESLKPYMLEEAAEVVDAIGGDPLELAGELGDVLLQVAFHSVIAEEQGNFSYQTVEAQIVDKLIRRHPHIFGEVSVGSAEEVVTNWNAIKALERTSKPPVHALARVPNALGALARGTEIHKILESPHGSRAAVVDAVQRAGESVEGINDVLEAVINWARGMGVNPEVALRERLAARVRDAS